MHSGINLESDPLLTLGEACRLLPRRPSPATLWRWRAKGINGTRLECVRVGGKWYTTRAAMSEFVRRQTEAATPIDDGPRERSASTQRRLADAGLV